MIPFMKAPIFILCLAVATHCWAEDSAIQNKAFSSTEKAPLSIYISTQNPAVQNAINAGLVEFLFQQPEIAYQHFQAAEQGDSGCILAQLGILLCSPSHTPLYREHLARLNQLINDTEITPVEEWYVSTFLQYLNGDLAGAAHAFRNRSATYKRDYMAAAWDIILNHYAGESTETLIQRADSFLQARPDNLVANYCRAIVEEHQSKPSDNALKCAQKALSMHSGNLTLGVLTGYLLARAGKHSEALQYFHAASQHPIAQLQIPYLHLKAGDTKSRQTAFLAARKVAEKAAALQPQTDYEQLLYWEGHTLLLRMLVLQQTTPSRAAIQTAHSICKAPEGSLLSLTQECLIAAIQARSLADMGRPSISQTTLEKAQSLLERLNREGTQYSDLKGIQRTCYLRAVQACEAAILRARLSLYSESTSIWQPHLEQLLNQQQSHFLPPVLPR